MKKEREGGSPPSGPGLNYNNCLDLETSFAGEMCLVTARLIRVTASVTTLSHHSQYGDHFTD